MPSDHRKHSKRKCSRSRSRINQGKSRGTRDSPDRFKRQRVPRPAIATESSSDSSEGQAKEDSEPHTSKASVALEARVALLEVENVALKAENSELKKKLIEALSKRAVAKRSTLESSKPGQAPAPDRRRERLAAAEKEPASDRRRQCEAATKTTKKYDSPVGCPDDDSEADCMKQNAVMLVNTAMETYNEQVPNNIALEKRLPLVKDKLERYMSNFSSSVEIIDLKSGGAIIRDAKHFSIRYSCVFRESGSKLKGTVHKRFYYDASGKRPTYSLDFETHEHLVTATPGTPQDGKLGVRDPRTEHLIVLYEEKGGKVTRMWLRPDSEKLGLDPTAGEEVLMRTDAYKAFAAKLIEIRGDETSGRIFHNYYNTPSVG